MRTVPLPAAPIALVLILMAAPVVSGCGGSSTVEAFRPVTSLPEPEKHDHDHDHDHDHGHGEGVVTRVFFQDLDARTLKWADLRSGEAPELGSAAVVEGFPTLDASRQQLVQMEASGGYLLVGVREEGDERKENGWILVDAGVSHEDHGDHGHWGYERRPKVVARQLDAKQGNPAHLYIYDRAFYLANDENSGYTRLDPAAIQPADDETAIRGKAGFHRGGGKHITLAVADGKVGYSTWIDGGGPEKGRIDVTRIQPAGNTEMAYQFTLPSGGLHGATACQGKIFFAPSDGVCWVQADSSLSADPKRIEVHHIPLGRDEAADKPLRTGAFHTAGRHVLFVTDHGPRAMLCALDAAADRPSPIKIPLKMHAGNRPVTPESVRTRDGRLLAFVFHDHPQDVDAENRMSVVDLDPNGDGDLLDATVAATHEVGPCRLQGHYGHHSIAFDADGRVGVFSNPGDGTLVALDLKTLKPAATFPVGGAPTKVVTVGGQEEHH